MNIIVINLQSIFFEAGSVLNNFKVLSHLKMVGYLIVPILQMIKLMFKEGK